MTKGPIRKRYGTIMDYMVDKPINLIVIVAMVYLIVHTSIDAFRGDSIGVYLVLGLWIAVLIAIILRAKQIVNRSKR